ncbi:hypothetical protein HZA76_03470 [Candidatus Roizmanbacteria bacterium]|nr:hypothetical protein [Candidatus Roizmanbacteria bacterium]
MPNELSWKQDFINNLVWYVIFNFANVWIGRPMFTGGNMNGLRTLFYFLSGIMFLGSWIAVTKLLAKKRGWFIAFLISLPTSLVLNYFIIQIF